MPKSSSQNTPGANVMSEAPNRDTTTQDTTQEPSGKHFSSNKFTFLARMNASDWSNVNMREVPKSKIVSSPSLKYLGYSLFSKMF